MTEEEKSLLEKVITVIESDVKISKQNKEYLTLKDQDGISYSCWDTALWNFLGKNASALVHFTATGRWKNIVKAVPVQQALKNKPREHSPQEVGMWWKEVGEHIRAGLFAEDMPVVAAYYRQMSEALGIFPICLKEVSNETSKDNTDAETDIEPQDQGEVSGQDSGEAVNEEPGQDSDWESLRPKVAQLYNARNRTGWTVPNMLKMLGQKSGKVSDAYNNASDDVKRQFRSQLEEDYEKLESYEKP